MPRWTSVESNDRLLAALFATYDLAPTLNWEKVVAFYGNDANEESIQQQLRKFGAVADQMKLSIKSDTSRKVQKARSVGDKSGTKFHPQGKSTKSRASTKKSDKVLSGGVKKPTRHTIGKPAPAIVKEENDVVKEEEPLIKEEDLVPYIPVIMKDTYEDSENEEILYEWNWVE